MTPRNTYADSDAVENIPLAAPATVHAAILARKSTDKQAASIERQIQDARAFAERQGWRVLPKHIFHIDEGVSGSVSSLADRPDLTSLLEAARNGEITHVVVQQLDRLARDQILTTVVFGTLGSHGVTVWCYSTGSKHDANTPEALLIAQLMAYANKKELDAIRNRAREDAKFRARNGFPVGNKLYGYVHGRANRRATVAVDHDTAPIVREIFSSYADGVGLKTIARRLNTRGVPAPRGEQWGASTVRSMLENPKYKGLVTSGRFGAVRIGAKKRTKRQPPENHVTHELPQLAIVEPELWDRVAERFASHKKPGQQPGRPRITMLSGVMKCGICGAAMTAAHSGKHKRYACGRRHAGATNCANATRRPMDGINRDVVGALSRLVSSEHFETALAKQLAADRFNVEHRRQE
jgi:site-specific DNA recombinase